MNFSYYKYCLLLLGGFAIATTPVSAQNIENLGSGDRTKASSYIARNNEPNTTKKAREYTFKAPDSKVITNPEQLTKVQGYKVEVYGSAGDLLQQVRDVEPAAFIKGDIIQVGIFSKQINARDLVGKLAAKGLWARIIEQ